MDPREVRLTTAEAVAGSLLAACTAAIVIPYSVARLGGTIMPWPVLAMSAAAGAAMFLWLWRYGTVAGRDLLPFALLVSGVVAALVWLAWPVLLPPGGGSDLTHHLQLVDFIERHWRLPAGPEAERLIGGMVHYTPAVHLLAALAGRWIGRDGLHAMYFLLAVSTALKAGLVFLITRRLVHEEALRTPVALSAALVLFLPFDYFAGSFVRASFFAQALSEMFAVGMWWALAFFSFTSTRDARSSARAAAIFGVAGMGVFLSWPIWIGPPVVVLLILLWRQRGGGRVYDAARALIPIAVVAVAHSLGRLASAAIVQTGGSAFWPTMARLTWPFVVLATIGLALEIRQGRPRVTLLMLAVVCLQAFALLLLAVRGEAETPYMALKMVHLGVYPAAVLAAAAIAAGCRWLARPAAGWVVVVALGVNAARLAADGPPQAHVATEDLFLAGRWARAHVPQACVEYLVPQELAAYWLHHAVLGNPSYPPPGTPPPVFVSRDAVVRWLSRQGFPFAIADLRVIPREVREELDERARFGDIVVGARRGASGGCQ